MMFLFRRKH